MGMLTMQLGQTVRHRLCLLHWLTPLPGISVLQRTPNGQRLSTRGKALATFVFVSSGFQSQERWFSHLGSIYPLSDQLWSEKQGHSAQTLVPRYLVWRRTRWAAFSTNCPDDFLSGLLRSCCGFSWSSSFPPQ